MANTPAKQSSAALSSVSTGPKLIGAGVALFVLTRVINWLPLGLVGSWINGFLWPVLILAILAGAGLTFLKSKRA